MISRWTGGSRRTYCALYCPRQPMLLPELTAYQSVVHRGRLYKFTIDLSSDTLFNRRGGRRCDACVSWPVELDLRALRFRPIVLYSGCPSSSGRVNMITCRIRAARAGRTSWTSKCWADKVRHSRSSCCDAGTARADAYRRLDGSSGQLFL